MRRLILVCSLLITLYIVTSAFSETVAASLVAVLVFAASIIGLTVALMVEYLGDLDS